MTRRWLVHAARTCALLALTILPFMTVARIHFGKEHLAEFYSGWHQTVRQTTPVSCGPALLASMMLLLGHPSASELELIDASALTEHGITLAEFKRIAVSIGWPGTWYFGALSDIESIPKPVPVHLTSPHNHYVLVTHLDENVIILRDPAAGNITIPRDLFVERWSKYFYA